MNGMDEWDVVARLVLYCNTINYAVSIGILTTNTLTTVYVCIYTYIDPHAIAILRVQFPQSVLNDNTTLRRRRRCRHRLWHFRLRRQVNNGILNVGIFKIRRMRRDGRHILIVNDSRL
jgi:hypothetical protein